MSFGVGLALIATLASTNLMAIVPEDMQRHEGGKCQMPVDYARYYVEEVEDALAALNEYARLCTFLRQRGLKIVLKGHSGVLEGRAYATIVVYLADEKSDAEVGAYEVITRLGTPADSVEARRLYAAVVAKSLEEVAEDPTKFIRPKPAEPTGQS